jgi:hypothetical protein
MLPKKQNGVKNFFRLLKREKLIMTENDIISIKQQIMPAPRKGSEGGKPCQTMAFRGANTGCGQRKGLQEPGPVAGAVREGRVSVKLERLRKHRRGV